MHPIMLKTRPETKVSFLSTFSGLSLVVLTIVAFIVMLWVITFIVRLIAALIGLAA